VFSNEPIEDRSTLCEAPERADLISAHETAIALHVCREDSHQPPTDTRKV
jgi:hypothetical protein